MQPIVTVGKQFRGIPTLKSDVGVALPIHCRIERRIVWNLLKHLAANGWMPVSVHDGEERVRVASALEAMEVVFSVDESFLYVGKGNRSHGVALVGGNGIDIISDWNYAVADADGFDAVMDAFDANDYV